MISLIYPPVAKPCEPPAGIARLAGMLSRHGIRHHLIDANLEGLLHFFGRSRPGNGVADNWTKRAFKNRRENLSAVKLLDLYHHRDRYSRTVKDIGRVLEKTSPQGTKVGLSDYAQKGLSPVRSADLLAAAEQPEKNAFYPYFRDRLGKSLEAANPSAVGISLNYLSQALTAFAMIGFIRREHPGIMIILGGGLVTSWGKGLHGKNPFAGLVDHMVVGPGENKLLSLLDISAESYSPQTPDYCSLPRDQYLSPGSILPYSASSGCYWNKCAFCPEKAEENPFVPIPLHQVSADLAVLTAEAQPKLIHLLDNAISPAVLAALSKESPGVPWYGFARIGPHLADPDFCDALKRSGCVMLKLGVESGDQHLLDMTNKGASVEMASAVLRNLRRTGIAAYVYLLFGMPHETERSARKTLEFTVQHSDAIDFLNLAIFNMPVCGQNATGVKTREFYAGDLSLYTDFEHPQGWSRKRVRLFLEQEFRRHPAVSPILKNEPLSFTSNHAPFFVMGHAHDLDTK